VTEQWKPIAGYEGLYEVSSFGKVRSLSRMEPVLNKGLYPCMRRRNGRLLKACLRAGYLFVGLCKNGVSRSTHVHRIVAETFLENPENKPWVNHKNGRRKWDNSVSNLEWATPAEDGAHRVAHDLRPKGSAMGAAKLTEEQVIEMRKLRKEGWLLRELGARYDVAEVTVSAIVRGKTWKHVPLVGAKKPVQSVRLAERKAA